jgi:hypothetical protein
MFDTILTDYPRLSGETDDSARIQRAIDATNNGILAIPKGDYLIAKPLFIKNRCSLDMHPAARLIAVKEMEFVLEYASDKDYVALTLFNDDQTVYDNLGLFIKGGDIDGRGLASCFCITNAHHFTLTNTAFHNGKKYGLCVGGNRGGHIYELICNNIYCKCTMKGLSGNIGIFTNRHDAHFNDCIIVDYTIGMQILGSANRITRCHLWSGTIPPRGVSIKDWSDVYAERKRKLATGIYTEQELEEYQNDIPEMLDGSISFDIQGLCNVLDGCYADTAEIGYLIGDHTRIIGCDFFNNKLMGIKQSTVIKHLKGNLSIIACDFRGTVGTEILYDGSGENVEWVSCRVAGGENMKIPKQEK